MCMPRGPNRILNMNPKNELLWGLWVPVCVWSGFRVRGLGGRVFRARSSRNPSDLRTHILSY